MYQKYLKRLFDISLSLSLIIFLFPIMIFIFLVWITIGFPIFKQKRPGLKIKFLHYINLKLYTMLPHMFLKKKTE